MTMIERPSPNHDARPPGTSVDILLLHYTGMPTAAAALDRLCDPAAKVSAHYLIDEDGALYRLVPEDRRAWHAGASFWASKRDVNGRSIGIELVNPGHEFGYRPFPEPQMAALTALAQAIIARYPIPPYRVLGHSDVAPARKQDPGELFDWARLAEAGIGLWPPRIVGSTGPVPRERTAEAMLAKVGYEVPTPDGAIATVLTAFQRHFRPWQVDGVYDTETAARLAWLADQLD